MVYSKSEGWIHYVQPISRDERIWEGATGTWDLADLDQLEKRLSKSSGSVLHLGDTAVEDDARLREVRVAIDRVRRRKDEGEIELIRSLAHMAAKGYAAIQEAIAPGLTERQVQLIYENAVLMAGAEKMPYDTIVGAGTHAAVLHAIPTHRILNADEIVLIDAGADIDDYCVDITRVYPVSGTLSQQHRELYAVVLAAQQAAIAKCKAGVEWYEVHRTAARVIADGMRQWKLLTCSVDAALESGAISVFFPHGVGHFVGLRVRDTGCEENTTPQKRCGVNLRVDCKVEAGNMVTVEPGCYFIEALINDASTRQKFASEVDFAKAETLLHLGGVRIEDDILITAGAPDILTAMIPK
jgi:Xaa-Pro aminopeptidase